LYEGRVTQGPRRGTPIIFKVYPGKQVGGLEADMRREQEHHDFYLPLDIFLLCGTDCDLNNKQWLAFRNDGKFSAADYAKSSRLSKNHAPGEDKFWNIFEKACPIIVAIKHFSTKSLPT
ncbi:hypothetical protein Tco_0672735, partial [Tanacetum coccineum]